MIAKKSILLFISILSVSLTILAVTPVTGDAVTPMPCNKPALKCCKEGKKMVSPRYDPIFSPFSV